jgi:hypothetical protein
MNAEQFTKWVLSEVFGNEELTVREMRNKLEAAEFQFLNSGCYKLVYRHKVHGEYVVKVYSCTENHTLPDFMAPFYLTPIVQTQKVMIQEFANEIGGNNFEAHEFFKVNHPEITDFKYDVHVNNVKFHNGKPVIIDF